MATPLEQLHALYEKAEASAAGLAEQAVASNVFAELLATTATNAMAVAGILNRVVDRGVRATRFAAHADVVELARQLARTEDKLERLLVELEELPGRIAATAPATPAGRGTSTTRATSAARNGARVKAPL